MIDRPSDPQADPRPIDEQVADTLLARALRRAWWTILWERLWPALASVAVAMAFGPAAGLELVDNLTSAPALKAYHLLPSVRGDFLRQLGRLDEARAEFERAASLTRNARERELVLERADACVRESSPHN